PDGYAIVLAPDDVMVAVNSGRHAVLERCELEDQAPSCSLPCARRRTAPGPATSSRTPSPTRRRRRCRRQLSTVPAADACDQPWRSGSAGEQTLMYGPVQVLPGGGVPLIV